MLKDISPYLLLTLVLVAGAWLLTLHIDNLYISITVKILFVSISYCLSLWLLKSAIFQEAVMFITKKQIKL